MKKRGKKGHTHTAQALASHSFI